MEEVIVDDFIPCDPQTRLPCFAYSSQQGEAWCMLIEKAWAKLHGSYERIEAGFAENVMTHLTGAPNEVIEIDDERLWEKCQQADQNGWIMAASAGSTGASVAALEDMGLIGYHAYGLIGVVEVTDRFDDKVKLF